MPQICGPEIGHNLFEVANILILLPRVGPLGIGPTLGFETQPLRGFQNGRYAVVAQRVADFIHAFSSNGDALRQTSFQRL